MYPSLTAIVLTYNEENNIVDCLKSLGFCSRLIVVDSGSSDFTVHFAKKCGADIYIHESDAPFLITNQRNWALLNCEITTPWVLFLDADERVTPLLEKQITKYTHISASYNSTICAFYLAPKYLFLNKWLRFSQHYPNWHPRLLRSTGIQFSGGVWESFCDDFQQPLASSQTAVLSEPYEHIAFSKGINDWLIKHLRYADWDARSILSFISNDSSFARLSLRRKPLLRVVSFYFWPFRPFMRFTHKYVLSLGFLDGWQGFIYCLLMFFYEIIVVIKVLEVKLGLSKCVR